MSDKRRDEFKLPEWSDHLTSLNAGEGSGDEGRISIHFPDGSEPLSMGRRDFLKVASAAAAATGLTAAAGCRVPQDKIVPYVDRPEEVYHGVPNTYTTVCRGCSVGCGALLTVREGRVTKMEGNPDHPMSEGALCAIGQGAPLDVFSPDRVRKPMKVGRVKDASKMVREDLDKLSVTWETLDKAVIADLVAAKGGKVRLLTGPTTGPAQKSLIDAFVGNFSDAKHIQWEPLAQTAQTSAHQAAYGSAFEPFYRFDNADAVVSFGAEFLDNARGAVIYTRQFSKLRDPDLGDKMSHFVAFEGRRTLTGSAADLRHRVRTSDLLYTALSVASELVSGGGLKSPLANNPAVKATLGGYTADKIGPAVGLTAAAIRDTAAALKAAGSRGLAVCGRGGGGGDTTRLATVTALINELIGAVGTTVEHTRALEGSVDWRQFEALHKELSTGSVDVLIVSGVNPAYDAPSGLKMVEALGKAKKVIVVDTLLNETAVHADWFAAAPHWLETWGDSQPLTGTFAIQQPGMQPLHDNRSLEDCLITWAKGMGVGAYDDALKASTEYKDPQRRPSPGPWYFFLSEYWKNEMFRTLGAPTGGDAFWEAVARKGAFTARRGRRERSAFNAAAIKSISGARADKAADKMELELFATNTVYDGRGGTNPVLAEQPDTLTKASWGNCACVAPSRFKALGLTKLGDVIKITTKQGEVSLPTMIIPGMHSAVVAVAVGYGRTQGSVVANGVGVNAFGLASTDGDGVQYAGLEATVGATGGYEELGMARESAHVLSPSRKLVPKTTLEAYKKDKRSGAEWTEHPQFWGNHKYPKLKWGMTVDLSRCTGCGACLTACSVENNVPIVGKQGVLEGRLMHWIRIDRYYALPDQMPEGKESYDDELLTTSPLVAAADYLEDPEMLLEPMMCQHCDNAPCETVCPVAATVHSSDGLNEQVYNRCVGTRYCANNCPYKQRRFNWYNYNEDRSEEFIAEFFPEIIELANLNARWPQALRFNPEVTVRARGVMEKCTFCVQRLRRSTVVQKKLGIASPTPPQTACQQTCPANAIDFGNTSDVEEAVTKKYTSERAFSLLDSVGTKPAVRYLTRVRNTKKS